MNSYFRTRDARNMRVVEKCCEDLPKLCTEYFDDLYVGRASSTLANYARQLKTFFEFIQTDIVRPSGTVQKMADFDLTAICDIRSDSVVSFVCSLKAKGNTDATILSYLRTISTFYSHFVKKGTVLENPVESIIRPKNKKSKKVYLDDIDAKRFADTVSNGTGLSSRMIKYNLNIRSGPRDVAIFSILLDTGIRVSELIGLDLQDVDLVRCRITVQRKGGNIDTVYFSDDTLAFIKEYLTVRTQVASPSSSALLVSMVGKNKGERLSVRSVELMTKKYAVASGVTNSGKMTPHKMRHTCAMVLLKMTNNIALVQKHLGHSSITSTTIYAEADDSDLESIRNIKKNR